MKILELSSELVQYYDKYLLSKECSLFYYSSKYRNFIRKLLGCNEEYLVAIEDGTIHGVLPLMYNQVNSWHVYNSLPYYGSNGGILADNDKAHNELLNAYNEIAQRENTLSCTMITNPLIEQRLSGVLYNYTDYRIGQLTRLSAKIDDWQGLLGRIEPSARRNIKKALRENITVEVEHNQLKWLYKMHLQNIQGIGGIPKSKEFFTLIPQYFIPGEDFDLYVAKLDGVVIAGLLVFYFNQIVEYFTPAIDREYRSTQPLSLIIMYGMTEAAKRGFKWWNWGGTWPSQVGVYRFKKKWAAIERKYYYYTQLNNRSILQWPRDKILKIFPNFFIVPFSALNSVGNHE